MTRTPIGITSLEPARFGERRWNGSVWASQWTERYNQELERIAIRHQAGMGTQHLVDGLYNLANGFDYAGKDRQ